MPSSGFMNFAREVNGMKQDNDAKRLAMQGQNALDVTALQGQNQLIAGQQSGNFGLQEQGMRNQGAIDLDRLRGIFGLQNQALQNQGALNVTRANNGQSANVIGGGTNNPDPFQPLYNPSPIPGMNLNNLATPLQKPKPISSISIDKFNIDGFERGGIIAGVVNKAVGDDTMIKAKKGEYVIPVEVVEHLGEDFFDNLVMSSKKQLGMSAEVGPQNNGYREGGKVIELYDTPPTQNLPVTRQVMAGNTVGEGSLETPYRPTRVPAPTGGGIANVPVPIGGPNNQGFTMGDSTLYTEPRGRIAGIANPPATQQQRMYSDMSINAPKMNKLAGIASIIPVLAGMAKNVNEGRGALGLDAVPEARAMVRDAMSGISMIPSHDPNNPVDLRKSKPSIAAIPQPVDKRREEAIAKDAAIMAMPAKRPIAGIADLNVTPEQYKNMSIQQRSELHDNIYRQHQIAGINQANAQTQGLQNQITQGKPATMIAKAQEEAWAALSPAEKLSIGKAQFRQEKPQMLSDDILKYVLENGDEQQLRGALMQIGPKHPAAGILAARAATLKSANK